MFISNQIDDKLVFDFLVRPEVEAAEYQFKACAITPPDFRLVVADDTPPSSKIFIEDIPEFQELKEWCETALGIKHTDWSIQTYIDFENRIVRNSTGNRLRTRKMFIQVYMRDVALLAIFKLRWS